MTSDTNTALSHLHVIELGGGAASYGAHYLAHLGANVTKVEPPAGDPARQEPPFAGNTPDQDGSLSFIYFNADKRGIVLDLQEASDRQALLNLATSADIILEAHQPGYLDALSVGFEQLRAANPRLVLVSLTPFGQTGPLRDYKGNNAIAEAMSGVIFGLGDDTRSPCVSPNEMLTQVAGVHGAYSALAGVFNQRQGGSGQHVDISIQEVGTHMQVGLADYGVTNSFRRRPGIATRGGQRPSTRLGMATSSFSRPSPACGGAWLTGCRSRSSWGPNGRIERTETRTPTLSTSS